MMMLRLISISITGTSVIYFALIASVAAVNTISDTNLTHGVNDSDSGVDSLHQRQNEAPPPKKRADFIFLLQMLPHFQSTVGRQDMRAWLPRPAQMDEICYDEIIYFIHAVTGYGKDNGGEYKPGVFDVPPWALQMFDAFGKPGAGLLEGSVQLVGAYDECLDVRAEMTSGSQLGSSILTEKSYFDTQYCRVEITLDKSLWERTSYASRMNHFWASKESPDISLNWGVCVPKSCREEDIILLLTNGTLETLNLDVNDVICYEEKSTLGSDASAIFVIVLLSVYVGIVLGCTVLESWWHYSGKMEAQVVSKHKEAVSILMADGNDQNLNKVIHSPVPFDFQEKCQTIYIPPPQKSKESKSKNSRHTKTSDPDKKAIEDDETNYTLDSNNSIELEEKEDSGLGTNSSSSEETGLNKIPHEKVDRAKISRTVLGNSKKPGYRIVKMFSLRQNLIGLVSTSPRTKRRDVIQCINGIRVFSMLWIMLGHTYTFGALIDEGNMIFGNLVGVAKTTSHISFFLVVGATFAVDTFFLISGLLVAMLTLKKLEKCPPTIGFWCQFIFHRVLRLVPVYAAILMSGITLYDHLVSGPMKAQPLAEFKDCHSKWWSHLLFVNNFVLPQEKCMTWTWFLAVDFQLFMLSSVVIYVIHRSYRLGLTCAVSLLLVGILSAFIAQISYPGQFVLMDLVFRAYWEHVYIVPWARIGAFALGMLTGVFLLGVDKNTTVSKSKALLLWLIAAVVALFIIFIPHNQWKEGSNLWPVSVQALYEALSRPMFALCVAWVIYSCHTGTGGVVNNILSWPGFQPVSRITYSVYLVHPIVMTFFVYSRNTPLFLQDGVVLYQYIGNVILSYIAGTLLCITFESPILSLEKILLGGGVRSRKEEKRNLSKC